MNLKEALKSLFPVQVVGLGAVAAGLLLLNPETASSYLLYEIFGALLASTITVFGLLKMKELT